MEDSPLLPKQITQDNGERDRKPRRAPRLGRGRGHRHSLDAQWPIDRHTPTQEHRLQNTTHETPTPTPTQRSIRGTAKEIQMRAHNHGCIREPPPVCSPSPAHPRPHRICAPDRGQDPSPRVRPRPPPYPPRRVNRLHNVRSGAYVHLGTQPRHPSAADPFPPPC